MSNNPYSSPKETPTTNIKPSDWRVAQKYIRITHNKAIKLYFGEQDTSLQNTTNLRNSLLIYKKDSAIQCLSKMLFFEQHFRLYEPVIPAIPEWWQVRKGASVPQLVVTFKPKNPTNENKSSRWSLSFPHFDNNQAKAQSIKGYTKGNYQGIMTLKDNSKVIIYAGSENEAESTLKGWLNLGLFDSKYTDSDDLDIKIGKLNTNFQELPIVPVYAKYYPKGQKNLKPDWIIRLD